MAFQGLPTATMGGDYLSSTGKSTFLLVFSFLQCFYLCFYLLLLLSLLSFVYSAAASLFVSRWGYFYSGSFLLLNLLLAYFEKRTNENYQGIYTLCARFNILKCIVSFKTTAYTNYICDRIHGIFLQIPESMALHLYESKFV